jgi:IS30 family transposase
LRYFFAHFLGSEGKEVARHMTLEDRKVLEARYNNGQSITGIARAMSFNWSTIYRELQRGDTGEIDSNGRAGYSAELGQMRIYNAKQRLRDREYPGGLKG